MLLFSVVGVVDVAGDVVGDVAGDVVGDSGVFICFPSSTEPSRFSATCFNYHVKPR